MRKPLVRIYHSTGETWREIENATADEVAAEVRKLEPEGWAKLQVVWFDLATRKHTWTDLDISCGPQGRYPICYRVIEEGYSIIRDVLDKQCATPDEEIEYRIEFDRNEVTEMRYTVTLETAIKIAIHFNATAQVPADSDWVVGYSSGTLK
jgi:hypothetical protein